jgi:hypothetical protein
MPLNTGRLLTYYLPMKQLRDLQGLSYRKTLFSLTLHSKAAAYWCLLVVTYTVDSNTLICALNRIEYNLITSTFNQSGGSRFRIHLYLLEDHSECPLAV